MKKLLGLLLSLIFTFGLAGGFSRPADAHPKKKAYRKVKYRKYKKPVRKKRVIKKKRIVKKTAPFRLPAPPGTIARNYSIEEGLDETEAENLVAAIKSIGVAAAAVDVNNNSLSVKFDPAKVSAVKILSKLKSLGYTVKRID